MRLKVEHFTWNDVGGFDDIYQEDPCDQGEWNSHENFYQASWHVYFVIKHACFIHMKYFV